jgi:photosystem II oxygen-evolving enhancer protein 3
MVMATPSLLLTGATATAISGTTSRRTTCQASSQSQQPSRRSACLGLGLAAVVLPPQRDVARAADDPEPEPANNGWWLTEFPLPVPKIQNSM